MAESSENKTTSGKGPKNLSSDKLQKIKDQSKKNATSDTSLKKNNKPQKVTKDSISAARDRKAANATNRSDRSTASGGKTPPILQNAQKNGTGEVDTPKNPFDRVKDQADKAGDRSTNKDDKKTDRPQQVPQL